MLEHHRAKRAAEQYQHRLAEWSAERDAAAGALRLATTFSGEATSEMVLGPGEACFARVTNASLVEDRRGAGHYEGRSSGVSIPVASLGGHAVRYHVGATRGHYVQGAPSPTAVDTGTLFITNQRVVFTGDRQTRECRFAKLIGFRHGADGSTTFSVSNRQKATTVHYGPNIAGWVDFRLDLALANFRGQVPGLVSQLQADLATVDRARPAPPEP